MKAFAFIYSRTKYDNTGDYRILSNVSESVIPVEVILGFERSVLSLTSAKDVELQVPQWLFIKKKGFALWGVAGNNVVLNDKYGTDDKKRPLRNFTGIIIPNYSGQNLPNDMAFFSAFFSSIMEQLYDSFVKSFVNDFPVDVSNASKFIHPKPFDNKLNTDYHQCRVFSTTVDAESLVASCLSCPDDISIAINVARIESVTTPRFNPLTNAVMREAMPEEITDIPVKHLCGNCGKAVDDIIDGLCQDCWNTQHPRCSNCDKETSQLHEGLCQDCWNRLHPRCRNCTKETSDLCDGLCKDCYELQHPRCKKCNTEFDDPTALSSRGLCEKCERKRHLRIWIGIGIVLLSLLFTIVRYEKDTGSFYFRRPVIERNDFFKRSDSKAKELPKQQEKRPIEYRQVPHQEERKDVQPHGHGGKSNTHHNTPEQDTQKQIKDSVPNKLVYI